jgi:hypothetical protein
MEAKLPTHRDTILFGRRAARRGVCLAGAALLLWTGCSREPSAPPLPRLSPSTAASKAMTLYDLDGNGRLSLGEITQAPALRASWSEMDTDRDGELSHDEIAARVRAWRDSTARMMKATATIYLKGQPLAGATVTLEPVEFLGPNYPSATAVTDERGTARLTANDQSYPGVYLGLYTVRVSKLEGGKETIPARYNTESRLFYEVSREQWTNMLFNTYRLQPD